MGSFIWKMSKAEFVGGDWMTEADWLYAQSIPKRRRLWDAYGCNDDSAHDAYDLQEIKATALGNGLLAPSFVGAARHHFVFEHVSGVQKNLLPPSVDVILAFQELQSNDVILSCSWTCTSTTTESTRVGRKWKIRSFNIGFPVDYYLASCVGTARC